MKSSILRMLVIVGTAALLSPAAAQEALPAKERVASLKKSLQESQILLRSYEWIETTIVTVKGEEKSRQENRCYHGADGKLQKIAVGDAPAPGKKPRGIRGAIAKNKQEEMADYIERAKGLVHRYIPPDPALIQKASDAGRMSIRPMGQRMVVELEDYVESGDLLGVEMDLQSNRLLGVQVKSYLEKPEDSVGLVVRLGALADGATYPEEIVLDIAAKELKITVQNSGYRKMSP